MKKYLYTTFFALSLFIIVNAQPGVVGQYFNGQIKQSGSVLQFFIRPNPVANGGSNITSFKFDNFDFFIRYPNADPLATYGAPVVNTVDFPGLTMAQDIFGQNPYGPDPGYRLVEWTSPFGNSTNTPMTYNAGQEYMVFSVTVTNFSANFQFSADNTNGAPYFLTITRNTAGIGGFSDYTAQGAGGNIANQLFYGPAGNLLFVPPFLYYQKVSIGATSSASDYYRSITSGNWNVPATWESSSTSNFASVISPATLTPDNNSAGINIRSGHTVTVTANVTTDKTFVNPGATLTVTGSTLTVVNNGLTVQSDVTGTGRIGNSTGTISGNANVQRFIPANVNRAWRLLSIPTTTVQSIKAAWQNGQASGVTGPNGLGMWITSSLGTAVANGYDAQTTGSSMLSYNAAGNSWTNTTTSTSATNIASDNGYLVYIRGDRTSTNSNVTITSTTLSTTGSLKQGIYPGSPISVTTGLFGSIGNPYASQIDFRNVTKTPGIDNLFYVWDPKLATTGGYQTLTLSGANYVITPGGGSYGGGGTNMNTIESGMAFFVHATSTGTVQFTEGAKSTGNNNGVFGPNGLGQQLVTNLYLGNTLADGVLNLFDKSYANAVDNNDALKLINFGENLGIARNGSILSVEKRSLIGADDVIEFNLAGMHQMQYRLEFSAANLEQPGLTGTLEDNYLETKTPINLNGITNVVFTVDANPASSAANRFRIVFKTAVVAVPAGKPDISIYPNPVTNGNISVQFTNMQKGIYTLRLINSAGQAVMISQLTHPGGSALQPVTIGRSLSKGSYLLEILQQGGTVKTQQIIIQ